jgi:hypothetical protein
LQGCPCPDLNMLLDDVPYTNPEEDNAPWYDPAVDESEDFAGVWVQQITGLQSSTITREYVRTVVNGAVPLSSFDAERVIAVTAYLAASSQQGLSYGLAWLASALRGSGDCDTNLCTLDSLCFLNSCPDFEGTQNDANDAWNEFSRYVFDVGLVAGPTMSEKRSLGSCGGKQNMLAKVEWTMTAGIPWIFSQPVLVGENLEFVPPSPPVGPDFCDVNWVSAPCSFGAPGSECPSDSGCETDPFCSFSSPPAAPQVPSPCSCVDQITAATVQTAVAPGVMPTWLDMVPYIVINTGSAPMRRITVKFFQDPRGLGCVDLNDCTDCGEINMTFAPRDSTVIIDGRAQSTTVICPGDTRSSGNTQMFGPAGIPLDWPVFSCSSGMCVQVLVDGDFYASDASVNVYLVSREDAV